MQKYKQTLFMMACLCMYIIGAISGLQSPISLYYILIIAPKIVENITKTFANGFYQYLGQIQIYNLSKEINIGLLMFILSYRGKVFVRKCTEITIYSGRFSDGFSTGLSLVMLFNYEMLVYMCLATLISSNILLRISCYVRGRVLLGIIVEADQCNEPNKSP